MSQLEKQFTGLVNQILEKQPPRTESPLELLIKVLLDTNSEAEHGADL